MDDFDSQYEDEIVCEEESGDRRLTYGVWVRFVALLGVMGVIVVMVGSPLLFGRFNPDAPWNEDSLIVGGNQSQTQRLREQPHISEPLHYKADVENQGSRCGQVHFLISPDGTLKGYWSGQYDQGNGAHRIVMAAGFAGNCSPSKIYIEGGKGDPSKLYFIAKGTFSLMETAAGGGSVRDVSGYIYLRGWLDCEYSASGEIVISEDRRSFESFSWSAHPAD